MFVHGAQGMQEHLRPHAVAIPPHESLLSVCAFEECLDGAIVVRIALSVAERRDPVTNLWRERADSGSVGVCSHTNRDTHSIYKYIPKV